MAEFCSAPPCETSDLPVSCFAHSEPGDIPEWTAAPLPVPGFTRTWCCEGTRPQQDSSWPGRGSCAGQKRCGTPLPVVPAMPARLWRGGGAGAGGWCFGAKSHQNKPPGGAVPLGALPPEICQGPGERGGGRWRQERWPHPLPACPGSPFLLIRARQVQQSRAALPLSAPDGPSSPTLIKAAQSPAPSPWS